MEKEDGDLFPWLSLQNSLVFLPSIFLWFSCQNSPICTSFCWHSLFPPVFPPVFSPCRARYDIFLQFLVCGYSYIFYRFSEPCFHAPGRPFWSSPSASHQDSDWHVAYLWGLWSPLPRIHQQCLGTREYPQEATTH